MICLSLPACVPVPPLPAPPPDRFVWPGKQFQSDNKVILITPLLRVLRLFLFWMSQEMETEAHIYLIIAYNFHPMYSLLSLQNIPRTHCQTNKQLNILSYYSILLIPCAYVGG